MTITSARIPMVARSHDNVDVELVASDDRQRSLVERFIHVVFRRAYGARVRYFMPYLLSMQQQGRLLAALGVCPARSAELFLEAYLDRPVENVLAEILQRPMDRNSIIEVGNLASARGGGARALIITLAAYVKGAGYEWAVFTATPQVRNSFARLGVELMPLAVADKTRLGEAQHDWGSYYEQKPLVVAANIREGSAQVLAAMRRWRIFPQATRLWREAFNAGRNGCLWCPPTTLSGELPQALLSEEGPYHDA